MNAGLGKHICCNTCSIPFKRDAKVYYCVCERVFCELCLKTRECAFCRFGPQDAKRLYISYTDEGYEKDDEIEEFLASTYTTGEVLLQTHEGLIAELDTCRDLTKKLNEQLAAMTSAVEVAKARKENTLSTREGTLNRLEYLKKRVFEKEQELAKLKGQTEQKGFLSLISALSGYPQPSDQFEFAVE